MRGRTTFIIAHRLSTVRQADVIVVIENDRIVERGNHDELLHTGQIYASLYRSQWGEAAEPLAPPAGAA